MPFDETPHSGGGGGGDEPNGHQRAIDIGQQLAPQFVDILSEGYVAVQRMGLDICPDCLMRTVITKMLVAHCRKLIDDEVAPLADLERWLAKETITISEAVAWEVRNIYKEQGDADTDN